MAGVFHLLCWSCEVAENSKDVRLVDGNRIFMIKTGPWCHLTCDDPKLAENVYLREHPFRDAHDIKPLRLHCRNCANQLGVMTWSKGNLRPSFQQNSVIFKNEDGQTLSVNRWKQGYARIHNVITAEKLGAYPTESAQDPKYYIVDHKAWEYGRDGDLRVQKDPQPEAEEAFDYCLAEGKSYYTATYKSDTSKILPGKEPKAIPLAVDEGLTNTFSKMDLRRSRNPYRNAKPVPFNSNKYSVFAE